MTLQGKTAVVTGGSRGIGAAIAQALAGQGANVAVLYASQSQAAEAVCAACRTNGVRAEAYPCDVADFAAVKETVARIKADFGGAQILVNNAGIARDGLVATMTEEAYDAVLDTNLKGAFHMIRHMTRLFLTQKEGAIVNIASVAGLTGNPGQSNYAAAKAGLIGLTKAVAKELAPKGIRCNAVAPGFIATDMTGSQGENLLLDRIPLGRMGQPEEVAQAVLYLLQAQYVTGEVLRVDGGLAM